MSQTTQTTEPFRPVHVMTTDDLVTELELLERLRIHVKRESISMWISRIDELRCESRRRTGEATSERKARDARKRQWEAERWREKAAKKQAGGSVNDENR